jgi:hypothetical protein
MSRSRTPTAWAALSRPVRLVAALVAGALLVPELHVPIWLTAALIAFVTGAAQQTLP